MASAFVKQSDLHATWLNTEQVDETQVGNVKLEENGDSEVWKDAVGFKSMWSASDRIASYMPFKQKIKLWPMTIYFRSDPTLTTRIVKPTSF